MRNAVIRAARPGGVRLLKTAVLACPRSSRRSTDLVVRRLLEVARCVMIDGLHTIGQSSKRFAGVSFRIVRQRSTAPDRTVQGDVREGRSVPTLDPKTRTHPRQAFESTLPPPWVSRVGRTGQPTFACNRPTPLSQRRRATARRALQRGGTGAPLRR